MDMRLGEGAKISVDGKLRSAPLGLAGCCVGARTIVGLGVRVAAGRYLPADLHIVASPDQTLVKIPDRYSKALKKENDDEAVAQKVTIKKGSLQSL